MESVKSWSDSRGWDYEFLGDEILELIPDDYRKKSRGEIHLLMDLARLIQAKKYLSTYERVVWVDADVLIFDPDAFLNSLSPSFAFSHEVWYKKDNKSPVKVVKRHINNAVCCFARPDPKLNFFIDATYRRVMDNKDLRHFDAGTSLLTGLNDVYLLPQFLNLGLFSPDLIDAILNKREEEVSWYASQLPAPIQAVNLCLTYVGQKLENIHLRETDMEMLCDLMLEKRGHLINQWANTESRTLARIPPHVMVESRS